MLNMLDVDLILLSNVYRGITIDSMNMVAFAVITKTPQDPSTAAWSPAAPHISSIVEGMTVRSAVCSNLSVRTKYIC